MIRPTTISSVFTKQFAKFLKLKMVAKITSQQETSVCDSINVYQ